MKQKRNTPENTTENYQIDQLRPKLLWHVLILINRYKE